MSLTTSEIKEICFSQGADLIGIAPVERFTDAPPGFGPADILDGCQSVIVLASQFPEEALSMDTAGYTHIRNEMVKKMNGMATTVARTIRKAGIGSKPVMSINGKWVNGRFHSPLSLKHAGELAGLGKIGKNSLLTTPEYGNMIWLSAVLVTEKLLPDPLSGFSFCKDCNVCVNECPPNALHESLFNQRACYQCCYKTVKGVLDLKCWRCRMSCPYGTGVKIKNR